MSPNKRPILAIPYNGVKSGREIFLSHVAFCRHFLPYHSFPLKIDEGSTEINKYDVASESH